MAFIGTLRNKMGIWVVVFVFVAISSFILGDLLGKNSVLMGSNDVGEIAGNTISLAEYQQAVQEREASYYLSTNRQPGEREMPTIRQQAWDMLILRYGIQQEIKKSGVEVTIDEVEDMIHGKNVDANVKQAFTNPQTGEFDRQQVITYLQQLRTMPENSEPRVRWEVFQRDLQPGRERIKYENLLIKSTYVTSAEAELDYHMQTDVAEVSYLFVPYYTISDSAVTLTDSDYKSYYSKKKERFKSEHTRDLKYVQFPVIPSADDTLAIKEELERLVSDLKAATDDSTFALVNSENKNAYARYNMTLLPSFLTKEELTAGFVKGPFIDGSSYKLVKVSSVGKDTVSAARASHILIRWTEDTDASKAEAKEKARNILKDIKNGADFAAKALEHGTDGTASKGGDLGYFVSGQMVKPFEKAVFDATKTGVLNDVVETEFGYHIIKVTSLKDNSSFAIATIEREITPSDASINEALRKAENFALDLSGIDDFTNKATKETLTVYEAKTITSSERRINSLSDARQIIQWLFRDAEKGKVSDVFDLKDSYVVAVMTDEIEKGYKPLELVKEEITPAVRNQVKAKVITDKLNASKGSLEEMAAAFGKDASVYSMSDLNLGTNNMTSVGLDPEAVGVAFAPENGKRSKIYAGEKGVLVSEMKNKTIAPAIADYTSYKNKLKQTAENKSARSIVDAIKDKSNISDERYKFY